MYVKKRDGRIVDFDKQKIINAILAAFESVDGKIEDYALIKAENIAAYIQNYAFEKDKILEIEEIQDLVEKGLMSLKRKDIAKAYILYREERTKIRNKNTSLMQTIAEKILANNVQNQNANVDEHSFGGRAGEARDELLKDYALNYIVSDMAKANHLNNEIYIHDLSSYALGCHNCLTIPFDDILAKGFNTRQIDVRPAQSVNTAFQLVAVIFQLQSLQQFGGVSASHLDWTMVPYVKKSFYKHYMTGLDYLCGDRSQFDELLLKNFNKEQLTNDMSITDPAYQLNEKVYKYALDMTTKEVHQAAEGLYHNLNTLQSRSR